MKKYFTDILFMLSATLVVVLFAVSAPATFDLVRVFHSDGTDLGIALSVALMLSLELSAIGFKLATLQVPEWRVRLNLLTILFLGMTMVANYVFGANQSMFAALNPVLKGWFEYPYVRGLAAFVYAATVPVFLYTALSILAARWKMLQGSTAVQEGITTLADKRDLAILETLQVMQHSMQTMLQRVEQPVINNLTVSPPLLASASAQQVTDEMQPETQSESHEVANVNTETRGSKAARIRGMIQSQRASGLPLDYEGIAKEVNASAAYVQQSVWRMDNKNK